MHGPIYPPAVGGAPRQTRWGCTWKYYLLASSLRTLNGIIIMFMTSIFINIYTVKILIINAKIFIFIIIVKIMIIITIVVHMMMMMMIFPSTHRVTYLWAGYPPVKTIVSPASGIPHASHPLCFNSKLPPPVFKCEEGVKYCIFPIWYLAQSLQWALLHYSHRQTVQSSREERLASRACDIVSPHCDCLFKDECEAWLREAGCCAIFLCYLVCEMWWLTQKLKYI